MQLNSMSVTSYSSLKSPRWERPDRYYGLGHLKVSFWSCVDTKALNYGNAGLYNFTAVLFGMAGVQMLGKPDLVLEVFTFGNTWMWSLKCWRVETLGCSTYGVHMGVPFVVVSKMSACEYLYVVPEAFHFGEFTVVLFRMAYQETCTIFVPLSRPGVNPNCPVCHLRKW